MHLQDKRRAVEARYHREIAVQIEAELVMERGVDRAGRTDLQEAYSRLRGRARLLRSLTLVLAPGRFSMMNCWPSRSDSRWPIRRATMSVVPPGGKAHDDCPPVRVG